ncbi:PEBP-like protein [Polychaeton citri CBS 116435]|uniref:PEBP-like protein n=1 Tax=Polychaeton citri CBS 116435 TaxID=1314669 RepID=A0A9P4QDV7_9PEZI|nr:PEBP-like protein [Polychaeton citri CBS 116435]
MAATTVEITHVNEVVAADPEINVDHNVDEHVAFGGDDQWTYNPKTRRFDLSRGSKRKLTVEADDGIRNHRGCDIAPEKSLLVIVDMQNYFIHPAFCDHSGGIEAVQPLLKVIEKCRNEGIDICWLNWGIDETELKNMPPAVTRAFNRAMLHENGHGWRVNLGSWLPEEQGNGVKERCLFTGTWNADIYDPLKDVMREGDLRFDKARMSGLWSPELPMHKWLRQSEKKTLLFAGVNTDQCLLGTATDAYSWGWDVILLGDCAATMTGLGAQAVCDYNIATNMGFVTDSETFSLQQAGAELYHARLDWQEQRPVFLDDEDKRKEQQKKIIHELKVAEITPTVFEQFVPQLAIEASWKHDSAKLGNTIDTSDVKKAPDISHPQLIVALTDPDAPSRDDPKWSEMCHWLITYGPSSTPAFPSSSSGSSSLMPSKSYDDIYEYYPPGPPPKTGKHRYVLVALAPRNGTREPLDLEKPRDRRHWGFDYEGDRVGVSEWAKRNGLVVVGANFFYAINGKQ